jgi:hypothetical protein
MYEIHCTWPWQLWVFVGVLAPLSLLLIGLHLYTAYQLGSLIPKLVEMTVTMFFLVIAPATASSNSIHVHHWMIGWWFGMHCNLDPWWSRASMAWCWGLYLNGIAVYGRDPPLMCEYADFVTRDLQCNELDGRDWRHCSA